MTTNSFPAAHRHPSDYSDRYGDHSRHTHPILVSRGASSQHMPLSMPTQTSRSSAPTPRLRAPPERHDRGKSKTTKTESPAVPRDSWALMAVSHPRKSSVATLENARYRLEGIPTSEHSNEDRHFMLKGDNYDVFAVFDGHDGPRAAGFASHALMDMFNSESWKSLTRSSLEAQKENIPLALKEFFKETEKQFFRGIRSTIEEKRSLQAIIPPGMNSYQAYQTYPLQVARLQELEPKISGGTTAVVAVICNDWLYIANVGDSRAVLVVENEKGLQQEIQLSVDHGVGNIKELQRLVSLGLDRRQLESSGRLGSQENTRSIGDYCIKEGYRDVDTLQCSKMQPGICDPSVRCVPITRDCKYLLLMTDGVYKSIEAGFEESASIDSNKVLMSMLNRKREHIRSFEVFSDRVVDRIRSIHEDTYKHHASKDVRSPIAVSCRKRDDMTLLIHQFSTFKPA